MSIEHRVSVRNLNHSYPPYPIITNLRTRGELTLDERGMIFRPDRRSSSQIVIHWANLVSTYPSVIEIPGLLPGQAGLTSMFFLGLMEPYVGAVSVKFKEPTYDKVCVLEFVCGKVGAISNQRTALNWATQLDREIWEYKRQMRGEWN